MSFAEQIAKAVDGLKWISDTDDTWALWICKVRKPAVLSPDSFLTLIGGGTFCIDKDFNEWFAHAIYSQGESQGPEVGKRYQAFHDVVVANAKPRYVFKVVISPNRYAYYVVGIADGQLIGARCEAVET